MHQEFSTIQELIQCAQITPGTLGKGIYFVGEVPAALAAVVHQASGLLVAGFRITIDHSAITHILRQHGQAREVLQGQLPMELVDIAQLAEWLLMPTLVQDAGQRAGQLHCLQFEWITPAARVIAIVEVRPNRKRRQLALKTCYKKRPAA